jgi:hypothetical protein
MILLYQANRFLFYNLRLTNSYIRAYNRVYVSSGAKGYGVLVAANSAATNTPISSFELGRMADPPPI